MALSRGACGILLMALAGLTTTLELVFSKVVESMHLPYFRIMAFSTTITSIIMAIATILRGEQPQLCQLKWILLRGVFGTSTFVFSILAVLTGGAPGDVAALTSINIVMAAVMGHMFLSERLKCMHLIALLSSISGAMFIAKPEFVFGGQGSRSLVSYALAIASGFCNACGFISARKSADLSVYVMSGSCALVATPVFALLPFCPGIHEASLNALLVSPGVAAGVVSAALGMTILAIAISTAGSQMCPAAVSATVYTATFMVLGYVAQAFLFHTTPDLYSVVGAAMMLLAVVVMALTRTAASTLPPSTVGVVATHFQSDTAGNVDDDNESLASFIAAEFAEAHAPQVEKVLRNRRPASSIEPVGQSIGAVASVVQVSA